MHVRLRAAALATLPLTALAVLGSAGTAGAATTGAAPGDVLPGVQVPLLAGTSEAQTLVVDTDAEVARGTAAATIKVTYHGFSPKAKASFQRAVDVWATKVGSSVPITVDATYKPLGADVLGSAGPSYIYRNFSGAPKQNTYYVDAIANKRAGKQLNSAPDIVANFSSSFDNWHFGTSAAPRGTYDFQSVVMHELGHGLGFIGLGKVSSGKGSVRQNGTPSVYDRFVENGAGRSLLTYDDPSAGLATQIKSGSLFFDSAKVRSANGGSRAKLFAPGTYQGGSSYSHLDEKTYRAGNKNSLMTPRLGDGETIRTPGPITMAIFDTSGW